MFAFILLALSLLVTVTIVVLAILCIMTLRAQRGSMSAKTYNVQLLLIANLLVLVLLPVLFDLTPLAIAAGFIYLQSRYSYISLTLADFLPFLDITLSYLATLIFVAPYRQAVRQILWKHHIASPVTSVQKVAVVKR
uniref:G_PROTEIN_RECEP_F1_2 domain-containing protein n=1 Tax=Steinernema glaseri TaxID=37863 RepID=A0A1I7Z2X0_9BILA